MKVVTCVSQHAHFLHTQTLYAAPKLAISLNTTVQITKSKTLLFRRGHSGIVGAEARARRSEDTVETDGWVVKPRNIRRERSEDPHLQVCAMRQYVRAYSEDIQIKNNTHR